MAIKGSFYPTSGTDRPFYYSDFNANFKDVFTNGIATRGAALTTQMEVSAVSATMKSQVDLGIAYVNGIRSEIYTAAEEVTHDAADASNPRYDIVCLEAYPDPAGGVRNSRCVIVKGTAAGSPVVPDASLVQTDNQYQYPLANVLIPAAETDADNFTYTDRRELTFAPVQLKGENISIDDAGDKFTATDAEGALQEIAADGWVTEDRLGTIQRITLATGDTLTYYAAGNQLSLNVAGCTAVQLCPIVVGTSASPPAGTYPVGTIYVQYEA